MHRRQFIQLSGTALGGLFISNWALSEGMRKDQVELPSQVAIKLDDGVYYLTSSDQHKWVHKSTTVLLKYVNNALQVQVQSPELALHAVVMQWKYDYDDKDTFLGDHWERTYGDLSFQPASFEKKLPWYFVQHGDKATHCFGVKTGCNTICHWNVGNGTMQLTMDTRNGGNGVQLGNRSLQAADIIITKTNGNENTFATASRFCGMMCEKPRLPKLPVYGINDWYFAYGNNSFDLIKKTTAMMAELVTDTNNKPFSVIDAGWATYSPLLPGDGGWNDDFSKPNDKFKDMQLMGDEIKKLGMRPGLWMRPLCARHDEKESLLAPKIPGRDNPKNPVLDPTIPENIERIKHNFDVYKQWGYEMVKHDFTTYDIMGRWGFDMKDSITSPGWSFNDRSKTNAEIILNLYKSIREAAGDGIYVIGCNTMSHLSAGIFELCRTGDDTSGHEWDRTRKMGVNTLGFRAIQHNHFYAADGDCVGLTRDIPWAKNKQWMQLLAESGTPLFISAQPEALGEEQKQFIRQCFATAAKPLPTGEPLDWLYNPLPNQWMLNGKVETFDWS